MYSIIVKSLIRFEAYSSVEGYGKARGWLGSKRRRSRLGSRFGRMSASTLDPEPPKHKPQKKKTETLRPGSPKPVSVGR